MIDSITQNERLKKELKEKGFVNSFVATYQMRIKQAPTRISEIKKEGFLIKSIPQSNGSVNWVLEAEPKPIIKKEQKYIWRGTTAIPVENLRPKQLHL